MTEMSFELFVKEIARSDVDVGDITDVIQATEAGCSTAWVLYNRKTSW